MALRNLVVLLAATVCTGSVGIAPAVVLHTIPEVSWTRPQEILYEKQITVNGRIEAKQSRGIYLESPAIIQSVHVSVGDRVQKGQLLATVDTALTQKVLSQAATNSIATLANDLTVSEDLQELLGLYTAFSDFRQFGSFCHTR